MEDISAGTIILTAFCFILSLPGWLTALVGWSIVHHWSWLLAAQGVVTFWCALMCAGLLFTLLQIMGMSPLDEIGIGSGQRYGDY